MRSLYYVTIVSWILFNHIIYQLSVVLERPRSLAARDLIFFLLFVLYETLFDACDSCGCIVHKEPLPDWWFCAMQAADCFVEGVSALGYLMI